MSHAPHRPAPSHRALAPQAQPTTPDAEGEPLAARSAGRANPAHVAPPGKAVAALVRRAVRDFGLIEPGDRVAVGLSGGKDSLLLYCALRELQRGADLPFELQAVHLDQHQPGFARATFDRSLAHLGIPCDIASEDTWSVVSSQLAPGQIPCALCSRMRRGVLNAWCAERGFTKLALGHHLDDAVETFFLNLLYGRRLDPMKPATPSERTGVTTIRPLILVNEAKVHSWVDRHGVEVVPCPVCDSFPESRRRDLKQLLGSFRALHPALNDSVRKALYDV